MNKYIKKPVIIEAVRWDGVNLQEVINFAGDSLQYNICDVAWQVGKGKPHVEMKINTLEGELKANVGDYVIKGVKGEFYPCKPDVFEMTYELVK